MTAFRKTGVPSIEHPECVTHLTVTDRDYTILPVDQIVTGTGLTAGRTFTLPPIAILPQGASFTVRNETSGKNLTVSPDASDGGGSTTLSGVSAATFFVDSFAGVWKTITFGGGAAPGRFTAQIPNIPSGTGTGGNHVNASGLWVPSQFGVATNSDFVGTIKGIDPTLFQAGDTLVMSNNGNTSFAHVDSGTAAGSRFRLMNNTSFVNDGSFNTVHTFVYMKPFDVNELQWFEINRFNQSVSN